MSQPAAPEPLTSLTDGQWHRLHPATPLLRGGIFMVAVIGFVIANLRERLIDLFIGQDYSGDPLDEIYQRGATGWAVLVVAAVLIVILVVFYLSWRMHSFRIDGELVEVRSGLLFRSHRKARLDRVQGVNLVRPFIPRLFGAARIEVSVGGQDGNVQLAYLGSKLADDLRRDILRLASGLRRAQTPKAAAVEPPTEDSAGTSSSDLAGDGSATPSRIGATATLGGFATARVNEFLAPELDPDAAPPESVVRIPPGRLIGSIIFSGFTVFLILAIFGLIASVIGGSSGWVLVAILPGIIGSGGYYFSRITKLLRYSIAGTTDGVRVGFGLLSTSSETLPPGRIHAIAVSQPILWRGFGWWQIRINTAAHSSNQSAASPASTTILPVGTLADVAKVLELILPGYESLDQHALIEAGMLGTGAADDGFVNAPRRARWLRPFSWRRTGYTVAAGVALLRRGVVSRDLILVPLARLQGVGIAQGLIRRRLKLASARLATVTGPVAAHLGVIGAAESLVFFERMSSGAISSARTDLTHHWNSPLEPASRTGQPLEQPE